MKKALLLASVASMIEQFNMDNIRLLKLLGYEVHVACNFEDGNTISNKKIEQFKIRLKEENVLFYQIPFPRKIISIRQILNSYFMVNSLIKKQHFEIVHCHAPISAAIARMACKKGRKSGMKIIYTVHGFHFYKGAPIKNWFIFYPIEKYFAKFTDVLITINKEDYRIANSFNLPSNGTILHVPGVGVNIEETKKLCANSFKLKEDLRIEQASKVLLSVGELNSNKNHEIVIRALACMHNKEIYYVICGKGKLEGYLKKLCEQLEIDKQVVFAGYREDVLQIMKIADIFVFPSKREGLSLALMEAMATGLPVICTTARGNNDLIIDGRGGLFFKSDNLESLKDNIERLIKNDGLCKIMSSFNRERIKDYDIKKISKIMKKVYIDISH